MGLPQRESPDGLSARDRSYEGATPTVSVIVPVRNELRHLSALLDALDAQTLPRDRFEVVIADDGSDEPPTRLATPDDHVRVSVGSEANSYAARNRGAGIAKGRVFAFCDADCLPEPDWLEQGLAVVGAGVVIAGSVRFVLPERRTVWTLIDMDATKNQRSLVARGYAETANLFVTRVDFERVSGFDPLARSNGDYDFVQRCVASGASLRFGEDAVVWHPTRDSASAVVRSQWQYCHSYAMRAAASRRQVEGLRLRTWVPVLSPLRSRSRGGGELSISTRWLAENGVHPTLRESLASLPLLYFFMPLMRNVAQVKGALAGRRLRDAARSESRRA